MDVEEAWVGLPRHVMAGCLMTYYTLDNLIPYFHHRPTFHQEEFLKDWTARLKRVAERLEKPCELRQALCDKEAIYSTIRFALAASLVEIPRLSFLPEDGKTAALQTQASLLVRNEKLLKADLDRTSDTVLILLRLLCEGRVAQSLCAFASCERPVIELMDICTIISARGYDGKTGAEHENPWKDVVSAFKKLLTHCLMFMRNFIALHSFNKLSLWLDLFGHSSLPPFWDQATLPKRWSYYWKSFEGSLTDFRKSGYTSRFPARITEVCHLDASLVKALDEIGYHGRIFLGLPDYERFAAALAREEDDDVSTLDHRPMLSDSSRMMELVSHAFLIFTKYAVRRMKGHFDYPHGAKELGDQIRLQYPTIEHLNRNRQVKSLQAKKAASRMHVLKREDVANADRKVFQDTVQDQKNIKTATGERLSRAKLELQQRVIASCRGEPLDGEQETDIPKDGHHDGEGGDEAESDAAAPDESDVVSVDSVASDDTMEEEEDYRVLRQKSQITDVPIVLGPTEIEPLCLILQMATHHTPGPETTEADRQNTWGADMATNAMNTMILVSRASGRNLLREMLIYVAAWDLQEHEFYFTSLVSVMRSVLACGMIPHLYAAFREEKDIVSPTQAILIKVLAQIFKQKQLPLKVVIGPDGKEIRDSRDVLPPTLADRIFVDYIFEEFRERIIPETCALIYLQGQIRNEVASAEDFPLSLWDMERVYEGIYQFLEFFAVLSEFQFWKEKLIDWTIVSELISLLRELDSSIVKSALEPDRVEKMDFKKLFPEGFEAELAAENLKERKANASSKDVPDDVRARRRTNFLKKYYADKESARRDRQSRLDVVPRSEKADAMARNEQADEQIQELEDGFLHIAIQQAEQNELYDIAVSSIGDRLTEEDQIAGQDSRASEALKALYHAQFRATQAVSRAEEALAEEARIEEGSSQSSARKAVR